MIYKDWFISTIKLVGVAIIVGFLLIELRVYAYNYLRGWFINPTANAQQMVMVIADDWMSAAGILQCFERNSSNSKWHSVGEKIKVNLGASGIGWGIGLHGRALTFGPKVIEGAKKTPAGVFAITRAFGKDSAKELRLKLQYTQITATIFCPDDKKSQFYNRLVDAQNVTKDWKNAENMYDYMRQGVYAYGFVINHNSIQPISGRGSCFFVHVYRGAGIPTAGCVSFAMQEVKNVLIWLDATQNPILVLLPKHVYSLFKNRWNLSQI
jgi:L,D-peptidoglycan transpeptidase YkuD (ErfK/YbiS/YcfS/YnhG family)